MAPFEDGPSGLHKFRTFTREHQRPIWLVVIAALAAAILLPGLGRFGLWDPWEMQRAAVARNIAGGARVLVAEPPVAEPGAEAPAVPLTTAIRTAYPALGVDGPAELVGERSLRGETAGSLVWTRARAALESAVWQGVVVDASLLMGDGAQDPSRVAGALDALAKDNDGAVIVVVAKDQAVQEALRTAYTRGAVRSGLAMARLADPEGAKDADEARLAEALSGHPDFTLPVTLVGSGDEAVAALSDVPGLQWLRVQHKREGVTWSVPVLDAWLTAASYGTFGFSEGATRLPSALLMLFGVLLVFLVARETLGERVAVLSALALLTTPLAYAAARNLAGEASYAVTLLGALGSFMLLVRGGSLVGPLVGLVASAALLFLAKGLFGLLVLTAILLAWWLVTLDRRRGTLLGIGAVLALFGVALALVFLPDQWSFFDHFRFMNRLHSKGPGPEARNFDLFIRQIGFGTLPWSALVPFALGRLVAGARTFWGGDAVEADSDTRAVGRIQALVFLWFAVPLVMQMAMVEEFSQIVLPVAPPLAIALGLLLDRLFADGSLDRLAAVVVFGVAAMLVHDIKGSPEPLVSFLAYDPPFTKQKSGLLFPDDMKASGALMGVLLLSAVVLMNAFARLGSAGLAAARFFQRPRPLATTALVVVSALCADAVMSLNGRFAAAFKLQEAGRLAPGQRLFPAQVFGRPEHVLGILALGALLVWLVLHGTAWGSRLREAPPRPIGALARLLARVFSATRLHQPRVGVPALLALGAVALVDALVRVQFPEGYGMGTTFADPAFWLLVALTGAAAFVGARSAESQPTARLLRAFPTGPDRFLPAIASAAALCLYVAVRLSKEAWMTPPELWAILGLATAVGTVLIARLLTDRPGALYAVILGGALALAGSVLIPLVQKWREIQPVLFPQGEPEDTVRYVLIGARDMKVGLALLGLLGINALWGRREAIAARLQPSAPEGLLRRFAAARLGERLIAHLERGRVAVPLFVVLALGTTVLYAQRFVPDLSFHVSQKHIIDTWRAANEGGPEDNLFRHGSFGGASDEYNFYTRGIPEVADRSRVMEILLHQEDVPVKLATEGGRSEVRVIPGFSPANDQNADGRRDWTADAGIAERIEDGLLVDEDKAWTDNQWAGYLLVDSAGRQIPITSNTANTLHVQGLPASGRSDSYRNAYAIDDKAARDHGATAMERGRTFFLLPKLQFSELNYQFRKLAGGRHLPVLDDRSSRIVLTTSHLEEGEETRNWIDEHVLTDEELAQVPGLHRTSVVWEDSLELVGWRMGKDAVRARDDFQLFLYFKVLKETPTSWRLFMHIDKPGTSNRIGGDHYILNMSKDTEEKGCIGCFQTRHWMEGDIVVDEYEQEVPLGTPGGPQDIWIGFYNTSNDKRMKVTGFDRAKVLHDGGNRVRIGNFTVR